MKEDWARITRKDTSLLSLPVPDLHIETGTAEDHTVLETTVSSSCFPPCRKWRRAGWSTQLQTHYFSSPPTYHPICLQGSAKDDPMEHSSLVYEQMTFGMNSYTVDLTPPLSSTGQGNSLYHTLLSWLVQAFSVKKPPSMLSSWHQVQQNWPREM